jgi:spermidine synthase
MYTYLCEDDEFIMSDTPTEIFTNVEFVSHAHGDILIAGLGLGIMLKMLEEIPGVNKVTVIEKEEEIIQLVEDQLELPENFKIIQEDIFHYRPDRKYDVIYFDIWSDISGDALNECDFLENKFKKFLKPGEKSWCGSWRQEA